MTKLSKRLEKMMRRTSKRFRTRILVNKRYRDRLKDNFLDLQKQALKDLERLSVVNTLEDSKSKIAIETYLDIATRGLELCKIMEEHYKFYDQRGTFILFNKGKIYVFNNKTLRDKKMREGNIIFPKGIPKSTFKKAKVIKKVIDLEKYDRIDSGKYHFKQTGVDCGYYRFWGNKEKYFLKFDKGRSLRTDDKEILVRMRRV